MVKANKTPTRKVEKLNVQRDGNNFVAKWKIPSEAVSSKDARRFTALDIRWLIDRSETKKSTKRVDKVLPQNKKGKGKKAKSIKVDSIEKKDTGNERKTSSTLKLDREKWYPYPYKTETKSGKEYKYYRDLIQVGCKVRGDNSGPGAGPWCKTDWIKLEVPGKPTIGAASLDNETGIVTFPVTKPKASQTHEVHDVQYVMYKQSSIDGTKSKEIAVVNDRNKGNSFSVPYDVSNYRNLGYNDWVMLKLVAKARGFRGPGASVTSKPRFISYPVQATVGPITYSNANPLSDPNCLIKVKIEIPQNNAHPVDKVVLERLKNYTSSTNEAGAAASENWEAVDNAVDNGKVSGLNDSLANHAASDEGKYTWYRVITYHDQLTRASLPVCAEAIAIKARSAADDTVEIDKDHTIPGDDGKSIVVYAKYPTYNPDQSLNDADGTEISWSKAADAWESTEQPSTFNVTWTSDTPPDVTPDPQNPDIYQKLIIRGLTENEEIFIRARRYMETDEGMTYGPYSSVRARKPTTRPASVSLAADPSVPRGQGINVSWTFESDAQQQSWSIVEKDTGRLLKEGQDSLGATILPPTVFTRTESGPDDETVEVQLDTIEFHVFVSTGGTATSSDDVTVHVYDPPVISITVPAETTAQPLIFSLESTSGNIQVIARAISNGIVIGYPDGEYAQPSGTIVGSLAQKQTVDLDPLTNTFKADVKFPTGLDAIDGGRYTIEVRVVDLESGLASNTVSADTIIDLTHKAGPAGEGTRVYANPQTYQARIDVKAPETYVEGDVADIYRVTPSGGDLIASGVPFGTSVIDRFTPFSKFSNMRYRVSTRTVDGDQEWIEVPYNISAAILRFDWDGKSLELPYDISHSDSWTKDFENRQHIDGFDGYWNEDGTSHSASLSTDMIKIDDPADKELVHQLAEYEGPVFVRTPDGSAFCANVTVNSYKYQYNDPIVNVSFTADETRLVPEFMVQDSDRQPGPEQSDNTTNVVPEGTPPDPDPVADAGDDEKEIEDETPEP